jgi:hypothetical protein
MSQHIEWLNLIDRSGAFLEPGVLDDALPQGLEGIDSERRRNLLSAYDEWREAVDTGDADAEDLHRAWIDFVLKEFLEYDDRVLLRGESVPDALSVPVAEHGGSVRPEMAVTKGDSPHLLIDVLPPDTDLESIRSYGAWNTSALDRMIALCRGAKVTIGLVTNGERWLVVHVPEGGTVGHASWYGRIWRPEPVTLRAFQTLLGVRRCFGPQDKTLPALLAASLEYQDEVTDTLGQQVRRAVEVLIQSLDRADHDRHGELLKDVDPRELYEAGLTVMMRLVFLLCAEERGLLLLGEGVYDQNYAISTLRSELKEWQSRHGDQVLERRHDAWSRLLATFRAVFGGVAHEALRMPALGGSLFDPDRFPFLEGRPKGSSWRQSLATPLPIDNRTVFLLLTSLQVLEQRSGARLLSYKALDVEQIGHVYEGLLECTVQRLPEITLGLKGTASAKDPNVSLVDLERAHREGETSVLALLHEVTGQSESAISRAMGRDVEEAFESRLLVACGSDTVLLRRVKPWANLLRKDIWDHPLVYRKDAFAVTLGSDRRETGTHYTPKSLTERIVRTTLEPLVYMGSSDGKARETWVLRAPRELLDLKVCDPAMGSGAFLVQVCRYLGDRLVESWGVEQTSGKVITIDGQVVDGLGFTEQMPSDLEERIILARRLVAERCLYGVDINPMAVELAKLSIWLVTLAKGRPFGFLDHNFRCGDSLLGIHRLEQLTRLSMHSNGQVQGHLFGQGIGQAVREAIKLRSRLREMRVRDIRDVEAIGHLDAEARRMLEIPERIADAFIGEVMVSGGNARAIDSAATMLTIQASEAIEDDHNALDSIVKRARETLTIDLPSGYSVRNPFHWVLEYPEVFESEKAGFDAVVSNPPWGAFLWPALQAMWKSTDGDKLDRIVDSFHLFLIRATQILRSGYESSAGLLVPDVMLYQGYSQRLRETLLLKCRITHVCSIGNNVFNRVTRPCCYVVFSAGHRIDSEIAVCQWRTSFSENDNEFKLQQNTLMNFPGSIIPTSNLGEYSEVAGFVSAIPCKLASLVNEMGIQRGVSADNKEVFVMPEAQAQSERLEVSFLKRVVTGGIHLKPYEICDSLPFLIYTTRDTNPEVIPNIAGWIERNASKITCLEVRQGKHPIYALHRPRDPRLFEAREKLFGVITADRPKVAVDKEGLFALDGIFVLSPANNISAYYLAGLLNSSIMAQIYRVFSQEEGRVMAQVKPTVLAELPIVDPNLEDRITRELASKISILAESLHEKTLNQSCREDMMIELDKSVEKIFTRALKLR